MYLKNSALLLQLKQESIKISDNYQIFLVSALKNELQSFRLLNFSFRWLRTFDLITSSNCKEYLIFDSLIDSCSLCFEFALCIVFISLVSLLCCCFCVFCFDWCFGAVAWVLPSVSVSVSVDCYCLERRTLISADAEAGADVDANADRSHFARSGNARHCVYNTCTLWLDDMCVCIQLCMSVESKRSSQSRVAHKPDCHVNLFYR